MFIFAWDSLPQSLSRSLLPSPQILSSTNSQKKASAVDWIFVYRPPPQVYMLTANAQGDVLGGENFERWLGHMDGAFINGAHVLIKEPCQVRTQWKGSHLWTRKHALPDTKSTCAMILGFLSSRTVRNKHCL